MKNTRRDFLKITGLAGLGLANSAILGATGKEKMGNTPAQPGRQLFNMSGYAAPKIETVRIGFIGLGNRGPGAVSRMTNVEGVEIKAICDIRPERTEFVMKSLQEKNIKPRVYTGKEDAWKEMVNSNDLDLIYIATPWYAHTPMSVYAMEHGKHAACEVPSAVTMEECWQLVDTAEKTKKHFMMLENCCYDFFELMTLNMARQGVFGELVHGEGAYIHDLLDMNFEKGQYYEMWRLEANSKYKGNLYPTHGLGPIAQAMNINRGDKMDYLVTVESNDFMMNEKAKELAEKDPFYKKYVGRPYRGNISTTTIKTNKGKTIMVQHDVTSPRVYSRIHLVSGTKGAASKYPDPRINIGHTGWLKPEQFKELEGKYAPTIIKKIGELAKKVGGHGGMDFIMDYRLIYNLRNGRPLDMDVYDAATWCSITPLSQASIAKRSGSVDVPDFTRGSWKTNKPDDVTA